MARPSGFKTVDLNPFFNLDAIAPKGEAAYSRIDGLFALPAEELPRTGETSIDGVPFLFPDKGCMVPEGQVIEPPRDAYQVVHVLGNGVFGSAECELTFEFEGGEKVTEILKLTDGSHLAQFGEHEAFKLGYRYGDAGPVEWPLYIWKQVILLPSDRPLKAIAFGRSNNMRIFSLTLGRERPDLPSDFLLCYLLDRIEGAAEFKRLYHILAGLGEDLTGIRDQVLDTVRVDERAGHDFSRWVAELKARLKSIPAKERETPLDITLVGHSHIDAVWLWPWNVTVEKVHRTFSRNVDRLKAYPDVTFVQSQPQFYEWMERHYPELFEEVKSLVEQGRWEIVGGMWSFNFGTGLKEELKDRFDVQPTEVGELKWIINSNFIFKPLYGKFALTNDKLFTGEMFFVAGYALGGFTAAFPSGFDVGLALRMYLGRYFSIRLDVREYFFLPGFSSIDDQLFVSLGLALTFGFGEQGEEED